MLVYMDRESTKTGFSVGIDRFSMTLRKQVSLSLWRLSKLLHSLYRCSKVRGRRHDLIWKEMPPPDLAVESRKALTNRRFGKMAGSTPNAGVCRCVARFQIENVGRYITLHRE